jgi:hypothetical protein
VGEDSGRIKELEAENAALTAQLEEYEKVAAPPPAPALALAPNPLLPKGTNMKLSKVRLVELSRASLSAQLLV